MFRHFNINYPNGQRLPWRIPYVSGQYSQEAFDEGWKRGTDGPESVGLVTDQKVLENVFKGEASGPSKKAMYRANWSMTSWSQSPLVEQKSKQYQRK